MSDDAARVKYLKESNVHHLFELLASRVLSQRPASQDVFTFLRKQLDDIESEEKKSPTSSSPKSAAAAPTTTTAAPPRQPQQQQQQTAPTSSSSAAAPLKLILAVFGLDNAGKTALIHAIGGEANSKTTPTVGFSPTEFNSDAAEIKIYDLGGGSSFRAIWKHYFHDVHGIIYVVDGSDEKRLDESKAALRDVFTHPYIADKPVLLLINKKDKGAAYLGVDAVVQRLGVASFGRSPAMLRALPACALDAEDGAITDGVEWLLEAVKGKFDGLSLLVTKHSAEVKEQKKKALEEQAARVAAARAAENAGK